MASQNKKNKSRNSYMWEGGEKMKEGQRWKRNLFYWKKMRKANKEKAKYEWDNYEKNGDKY